MSAAVYHPRDNVWGDAWMVHVEQIHRTQLEEPFLCFLLAVSLELLKDSGDGLLAGFLQGRRCRRGTWTTSQLQ